MATVQFPGSERFDRQMAVHISAKHSDVSLALEFQKHLSNASRKHGILDQCRSMFFPFELKSVCSKIPCKCNHLISLIIRFSQLDVYF